MSGIEDAETIDFIAETKDGEYKLYMVETRPWGSDEQMIAQLLTKIRNYANFALSDQFTSAYPGAVGRPVIIQIDTVEAPTSEVSSVVAQVAPQLQPHGIGVILNHLDAEA